MRTMMQGASGEIRFDTGESLGPALTQQAFLATPLGASASSLGASGFSLGPRDIAGQSFVASLWFVADALRRVDLSMVQPVEATSWDDYSEDRELARKAKHDAWLEEQLGPSPWRLFWGDAQSDWDPRGGSSNIIITYEHRPAVAVFDVQAVTLDAATGDIALDTGERLGRGLARTQFLASRLGAAARLADPSNPRQSFPVDLCLPGGTAFRLKLIFNGEKLFEVVLSMKGADDPPVADYRRHWDDDAALARRLRDNELERKARHDTWLDGQLGSPPRSYPWGKIGSGYDAVFVRSDVIVEYA
jgi:hypothetical protein